MITATAVVWVVWETINRLKIFDFQPGKSGGFDWSPRSLAKNVLFAA